MAIALAQFLFQNGDGSAGSSLAITGSKTVVTGNDIIVCFCADKNVSVSSVSTNLGAGVGAFSLIYDSTAYAEAGTPSLGFSILRATVVSGGTLTTITVNHNATFSRVAAAFEYSGMTGSISTGLGSAAYAQNNLSPTGTEIAGIGISWFCVACNGDQGTLTPPSGYSIQAVADNGTTSNDRGLIVCHKIGTMAGGALSSSFGGSDPTVDWVTGSAFSTLPATRPALTGISFDGVTVR